MKHLNRASTFVGWIFLLAAAFLLVRPGGLLREEYDQWLVRRKTRAIIRRDWETVAKSELRLGAYGGVVVLVEYVDYECPYCRMLDDTLRAFLTTHSSISVVIRQLPHPAHPLARNAALAAICAGRQDRFATMHAYLMNSEEWKQDHDWVHIAGNIGIEDIARFEKCMSGAEARSQLTEDSAFAARVQLRATPALLSIRTGLHVGVVSSSVLEKSLQ
jgi:protein-disulfide isomerase